MSVNLSYPEIQAIQDQAYDYTVLGYDKSLTKSSSSDVSGAAAAAASTPQFLSSDEFTALTEGIKGGKLSIDFTKGIILLNDGSNDRVILGPLEQQ